MLARPALWCARAALEPGARWDYLKSRSPPRVHATILPVDVALSVAVVAGAVLFGAIVYLLREGHVAPEWVRALSALCGVGLILMLITDWPTDSLNLFWADHSVLAGVTSTLLLVGIPYLAWESKDQKNQERLAAGLSGAGLGGIVDHLIDAEAALALLSREAPPATVGWDAPDSPLKWMRALRPLMPRSDDGRPRASDPRSHPVYLPSTSNAWRITLTDQAIRRILAAMRDWSSLIGRSNDGTTALIVLSEVRKDLMELAYLLEVSQTEDAERLICTLRQRLRVLAYFFEDLSRNSTGKDTEHADTPFRPKVLLRLWPLPPLDEHFTWAADQEAIPDFTRIWRMRLDGVFRTLGRDVLSPMTVEDARNLAHTQHAGQVNKQGVDYFTAHLAPIAERLIPYGERAVSAGWLHDIVEDTAITFDDLLLAGAPPSVVRAVDSVSKRANEPYDDLIARAASDPLGRVVKLADNAQNISDNPALAATDPTKAATLLKKYETARRTLEDAERRDRDGF